MITRSKLAEQLREYQKRSQHKYSALTLFSPKPYITSWGAFALLIIICKFLCLESRNIIRGDVAIASMWAFLFCVILVLSYLTLYFKFFRCSFLIICLGVSLPIRLRNSRKKLARKRDLPLSM